MLWSRPARDNLCWSYITKAHYQFWGWEIIKIPRLSTCSKLVEKLWPLVNGFSFEIFFLTGKDLWYSSMHSIHNRKICIPYYFFILIIIMWISGVQEIYKRRPRRPPFLRVLSEGIGVTSSMRPIFMPERARARRADWAPGPGVLVLKITKLDDIFFFFFYLEHRYLKKWNSDMLQKFICNHINPFVSKYLHVLLCTI